MFFSFPLHFSFSGVMECFYFSKILPTFHSICILLLIYLYLAFLFGQQNKLWCWIRALFIVGFQMTHRYISAAAVADLVMPLSCDSQRDVALEHCGCSPGDLYNREVTYCRWWESIGAILMQSISWTHNAHNMHFTSLWPLQQFCGKPL